LSSCNPIDERELEQLAVAFSPAMEGRPRPALVALVALDRGGDAIGIKLRLATAG